LKESVFYLDESEYEVDENFEVDTRFYLEVTGLKDKN